MPHPKRATVATVLRGAVREQILAAYRKADWNTTHAAERLGVSRRTLLRWVVRYGLREDLDQSRQEST